MVSECDAATSKQKKYDDFQVAIVIIRVVVSVRVFPDAFNRC